MRTGTYILVCLTVLLAACSRAIPLDPVGKVKQPVESALVIEDQTAAVVVLKPIVKAKKKRHGKRSFVKLMKPIIQHENTSIMQDRQRLLAWQKKTALKPSQRVALQAMADHYGITMQGKPDEKFWSRILTRVDIVPLDMVLAQAANESSWGNSRFARDANNYFGQWCFKQGCGLVPLQRVAGAHHEVKRFASAPLSVRAYMRNLNTSAAYKLFRKLRLSMRRRNNPLNAEFLALGLKGYSERGMAYVKSIRGLVRANKELIGSL